MTTTVPRQVVSARRVAGAILIVAALGTVVMFVILFASLSTRPTTVVAARTTSNPALPPTTPPIAPPVSPDVALQQQVDADRPQVETLVGEWVPQLSSKTVGLVADGIVYDHYEILTHFHSLQARYPQALLLRSDDFASFEMKGYWVVVVALPYPDGATANHWCDTENIDPDNCFAKQLMHTGGHAGTTLSRK